MSLRPSFQEAPHRPLAARAAPAYNPPMFDALLPTKLFLPPARSDWVARPRLLRQLPAPGAVKLVLISAPAGYGKTTLVTAWLRQLHADDAARVCWLAVDPDDSDARHFFRYLAAAVAPLPGVADALPRLLQSDQPLPAKPLTQALIHDVTPVTAPFVLVLDDYHALDSATVDEALALLLEWMPPQMTLVLTSRSDPGFPIARLRARGQLIEIRADDLRFTPAEAAQFLEQTMGLALQSEQVAALEERTEGWIAGLQMAAHSLQKRDPDELERFVQGFAGSHRFVLDYLLEEALDQQPEEVRAFLLATAILERLSGALCDAVTGRSDGQALLTQLERENLFVLPLDDDRAWYRYHHLFADVLQVHAQAEAPEQVQEWHRRAAAWLADHGSLSDAIRHALAGEDFDLTADLLERVRPATDGAYQIAAWLAWARELPDAPIRMRPVLSAGYGWALLENGELAAAEAYLTDAARWLDGPQTDVTVADADEWQTLPASLDGAWAYRALALGDVAEARVCAQRAFDFFPPGQDHRWRRVALSLLAVASWLQGDLPAAAQAFADVTDDMLRAGKLVDAVSTLFVLAELRIAMGELNLAETGLNEMLPQVLGMGHPPPLGTSDLYRVLALLAWERGEDATAHYQLATGRRLGESAALTNWAHRLHLAQAQIAESRGDWPAALALLDEAEQCYVENPLPLVRPTPALKARTWIKQGALDRAGAWVEEAGLSPADEPAFLREFEHLTLARLLLARGGRNDDAAGIALEQAHDLLERLLLAAEAAGRTDSALEILILQALAHAARKARPAALAPLARALALAEPQGYRRIFVDEGAPMAELLQAAVQTGICVPYALDLLAAMGTEGDAGAPAITPRPQPLPEPLSERELEILALIVAGRKNQEIADELIISLNTVLYHAKNIYGKLGVNKRALAIAKARELGLIDAG